MRIRTVSRSTSPVPPRPQPAAARTPNRARALDNFVPAARKARTSTVARDPASALDFVRRYDATLGLSGQDLRDKLAEMRTDAAHFFQSMPALFVSDLAGPYSQAGSLSPRAAPKVTIAVDPHLDNFGTMRGADGHAVWGLNDFDQSAQGSPAIDLERLATSVVLQARAMGLSADDQTALVQELGQRYAAEVQSVADGATPHGAYLTGAEASGAVKKLIDASDARSRKDLLKDLVTFPKHGDPHFKHDAELVKIPGEEARAVAQGLYAYSQQLDADSNVARPLEVLDVVAKKGSGGSSLGLPRYYALVANADPSKLPVVLELKVAPPSPLVDPAGHVSSFDARIVVENQANLGGLLNPDTGATHIGGESFLVRELEPEKARVDRAQLKNRAALERLVDASATVLARAHAPNPSQAEDIAAWLGADPSAVSARLASFASAYADQVQADFAAFKKAS